MTTVGKVYLVGAGPGDPELLTVKALRVLRAADVVIYDRLVSREVLACANPNAQFLYAGKHEGDQERVQRWILEQMIGLAGRGLAVVRLKGGDPCIFGRGGEEWSALRAEDIEVELVPGVSSAVSVAGLAGIPVTFRGISRAFAVVTGHCQDPAETDWSRYAGVDTLVILMGVKCRAEIADRLMEAGRPANEPVAFIEKGTTPEEKVICSTLAEVAAGRVAVSSPALFVVGRVVGLREGLVGETLLSAMVAA